MKLIIILYIYLISIPLFSQESNIYHPKHNGIYVEALGSGRYYSINYERPFKLSEKVYLIPSIGWSRYSKNEIDSRLIPIKLHVLFGKNNLYGEAGLNYIHEKWFFWIKRNWQDPYRSSLNDGFLLPELGIRYYYKFLFFKASIIPIMNGDGDFGNYFNNEQMLEKLPFPEKDWEDKKLVIWPSVSVGVNFNVFKKKEK